MPVRKDGKRLRSTYVKISKSGLFTARSVNSRTRATASSTHPELLEAARTAQDIVSRRT